MLKNNISAVELFNKETRKKIAGYFFNKELNISSITNVVDL